MKREISIDVDSLNLLVVSVYFDPAVVFVTNSLLLFRLDLAILAQSICTHIFCFKNMGGFVTLKKGPKYGLPGCKKQGAKNMVIVIQKEKIHCYFTRLNLKKMEPL